MRKQGVSGRTLVAVTALVVVLAAAAPASATLHQRLGRALTVAGVSRAQTGAYAFDLHTGKVVFTRHKRRSFRPASNEKLGVALAALDRLGASYRIPTRVLGDGSMATGTTWKGRLVLRGFGDPSLSAADLGRLASKLRAAGIRRVTGRIIGDETYFDARRTAPGWRSSYYKLESPPLSALVVDRARSNGHTVDRPALVAARAFRKALIAAGVSVGGKAVTGGTPVGSAALASVRSATVSKLLRHMNKQSDNFYAEMLVKHLGAKLRHRGTTAAGCTVVRQVLDGRGVPLGGVRIVDGSGLSLWNRATARAVGALLRSAWRDPAVRSPLFASLAVAGIDGTLKDRMRTGPARGRVRGKTGTTDAASALSGYVGRRYVFSILQNGSPIAWSSARRSQDRFAQALARSL